jgi:hypothetical protein
MHKVSMEEAREGAVFPGMFLLVLMIQVKCSRFRVKSGKVSGIYQQAM